MVFSCVFDLYLHLKVLHIFTSTFPTSFLLFIDHLYFEQLLGKCSEISKNFELVKMLISGNHWKRRFAVLCKVVSVDTWTLSGNLTKFPLLFPS